MPTTFYISVLNLHTGVTTQIEETDFPKAMTCLNTYLGNEKYKVLSFTYTK